MPPPHLFLQLSARLRGLVAALLLVALPLHGLGGALLQMLGPDHRHEAAAEAARTASWSELVARQLQALVSPQTARLVENLRLQARITSGPTPHAHGAGAHHHHGVFARHHHAPNDASVVATGARADGQAGIDAATAGAMVMPLALPAALAIPPAVACAVRWLPVAMSPWHSHVPGLPERPPRA